MSFSHSLLWAEQCWYHVELVENRQTEARSAFLLLVHQSHASQEEVGAKSSSGPKRKDKFAQQQLARRAQSKPFPGEMWVGAWAQGWHLLQPQLRR